MQKYEREIAELLEQLEGQQEDAPKPIRRDFAPQLPRRRPPLLQPVRPRRLLPAIGDGQFMVTGILMVLLASMLLRGALQQWVAVLGILLFLWPLVRNVLQRGAGTKTEKMWRGRPVEPEDSSWNDARERFQDSARDLRDRFRRRY